MKKQLRQHGFRKGEANDLQLGVPIKAFQKHPYLSTYSPTKFYSQTDVSLIREKIEFPFRKRKKRKE